MVADKDRLREFAKMLALFELLPSEQRTAILYYTKGRLDAALDEMSVLPPQPEASLE